MLVNSIPDNKYFCQPVPDKGDGNSSYENGVEERTDDLVVGIGDIKKNRLE